MPVASGFHTGGSTKTHTGHFCTNRLALLSQTRMDKGIVWAAASRASLSLQCGAVQFDPATLGAAASSAPDLEHVLPFLRPGGRKLFHDRLGWHRAGRFPVSLQLLLAGAILAALSMRN